MGFWHLSEFVSSFIVSCPLPPPQYNPCLCFHFACWFHKIFSCLPLKLRRATGLTAVSVLAKGGTSRVGDSTKQETAVWGRWPQQVPASLVTWVSCHHLVPSWLVLALQSHQGFPGRKKLLAFYYLLQRCKRRRKAVLWLRSMASLAVEGHWLGYSQQSSRAFE